MKFALERYAELQRVLNDVSSFALCGSCGGTDTKKLIREPIVMPTLGAISLIAVVRCHRCCRLELHDPCALLALPLEALLQPE